MSRMADPPPDNAILIHAEDGHFGTAALDQTMFGAGLPILRTSTFPTWAEFGINVPNTGRYEVRARCASEGPRPVILKMDRRLLADDFCGLPTGGYYPKDQRWQTSGTYEFPKGSAMLRLESTQPFPHISAIALVPTK
jgi:hypothetical protein